MKASPPIGVIIPSFFMPVMLNRYRLPEKRGDFQAFTIDPLGELMEFYRSQPY